MQLSPISELPVFARSQLVEVLMNVPFPLTVLHGADHRVVLSNRAEHVHSFERLPIGKPFVEAYPDLAPEMLPILDRVYRNGISNHEKEIQVGDRYLNRSTIPLRGEDGLIEGVIVSTVDVTAEVLSQRAAENQKRWLEFVLDLIPVPTVLIKPGSGEVLLTNVAGTRQMASYPNDPNTDGDKECYFTDLAGSRLALQDWPRFRAARGEELYGLQLVWNCPTRQIPLVVDSRRLPQAFGHPEVVALHYHDVSDLKQVEHALRDSVIDLQRERDIRERFVATLTHDLRNPLTAVKITAQMIARENPESKTLETQSHRICGSIARADRMVRDLLDANRLKAGEAFPLRIGAHSLNDIAQACLDGLSVLYGNRFKLESIGNIRGRWCKSSVKRIFENLCGNAIKYGDPKTKVTVTLTEEGDEVVIGVHNYGNPIPISEHSGLFRPHHRTRTAQAGCQPGWGLGLALVRGLAEAHKGSAHLDYSDALHGTRFQVRLPRIADGQ